ncbi:hypothetical protein BI49514_00320 [Brevibacterium iodinum ATCC 49514]|uniref:Uncharacterized protein n=1 Tax=Brevibacterium iodinum ATCC 49514 TaxID=1255616 RepID=A0A2H1HV38_9MICO|nr:hypothetical protein [Brevibacterium iodinum]SMX66789.1 hypothetical protein BI49514_00320 [Brevibacterium iodinum ATCC 49514]SUW13604.1 Uncharacterised protein [Brevibacterium iodinum]
MNFQNIHRLTDEEHGTLNAALISYADEIEDPTESRVVRDLADTLISGDVCIRQTAIGPRSLWLSLDQQYTYQVQWSPESHQLVGTVAEFPSLSWIDSDPREAFDGIRSLVAEVLKDIAISGEEPPAPGVR